MVDLGDRAQLMTAIMAAQSVAKNTRLLNPGSQAYSHLLPGGNAISGVRINNGRSVEERQGGVYIGRATWLLPSGTAADYEVRFTQNSGDTLHGDTLGVWHTLSANKQTYLDVNIAVENANVTVEIRRAAKTADLISFVVTLNADGAPI